MKTGSLVKALSVSLVLATFASVLPAFAQDNFSADFNGLQLGQASPQMVNDGPGGGGRFQGGRQKQQGEGGGLLSQLNLTQEQREKMKSLMQSRRSENKNSRQNMMSKRQQLMEMIKSGSGSKEQALAMQREISQQQGAMMEDRISMIYEMKSILTPEQFQKFQTLMQQRKAQMGGKQGQGGPGRMRGQGGGFQGRGNSGGQGMMPPNGQGQPSMGFEGE